MSRIRLKRRKPLRSGICRNLDRVQRRAHKQWVRGHACVVPGCNSRTIQAAHIRTHLPADAIKGGTALLSGDEWVIPLCIQHHAEQHSLGEESFDRRYCIDRLEIAEDLQRRSPHLWLALIGHASKSDISAG